MQDVCNIQRIVDIYSDMILRIAYQHTGNIHDSQDIAQEVFLSILKKDMSRFDKEHEKAYIIRTTINKCNSFHRKRGKLNVVYLDEIYKNSDEPIFTLDERSVINEIRSLDKKYRNALYLHYYEGYKASDIARILNTTTGNVTSLLKRGREKLKHILKEENYG